MDWFEKLTGFREANYDETRAKLSVEGSRLRSLVNSNSYEIGQLELVSLRTLRKRAESGPRLAGRLQVTCGKRRRAEVAPGRRICRRAVPSSVSIQPARNDLLQCNARARHYPLPM